MAPVVLPMPRALTEAAERDGRAQWLANLPAKVSLLEATLVAAARRAVPTGRSDGLGGACT